MLFLQPPLHKQTSSLSPSLLLSLTPCSPPFIPEDRVIIWTVCSPPAGCIPRFPSLPLLWQPAVFFQIRSLLPLTSSSLSPLVLVEGPSGPSSSPKRIRPTSSQRNLEQLHHKRTLLHEDSVAEQPLCLFTGQTCAYRRARTVRMGQRQKGILSDWLYLHGRAERIRSPSCSAPSSPEGRGKRAINS